MMARKRRKKDAYSAFIGGFMLPVQRDRLRALAQLRGVTVSAVLRSLIDDAAARAAGQAFLPSEPIAAGNTEVDDV
jgi:hypothetical protein